MNADPAVQLHPGLIVATEDEVSNGSFTIVSWYVLAPGVIFQIETEKKGCGPSDGSTAGLKCINWWDGRANDA